MIAQGKCLLDMDADDLAPLKACDWHLTLFSSLMMIIMIMMILVFHLADAALTHTLPHIPGLAVLRIVSMCTQGKCLLDMDADDLAPLKEAAEPRQLAEVLQRAQWTEWVFRVASKCQYAPLGSSVAVVVFPT